MGFWHTSYIEHHEPTGLNDFNIRDIQQTVCCPKCGEEFKTIEELRQHEFSIHKSKIPKILISGRVLTPYVNEVLIKHVSDRDIMLDNCDKICIDGRLVDKFKLLEVINNNKNDNVVSLTLISRDGIESNLKIIVNIASNHEVEDVEGIFWEIRKGRKLNRGVIDIFIKKTQPLKTVRLLTNGICQYLYGVLAKEKSEESNLRYEEYENKFNAAQNDLKIYDCKLSKLIRGLILFHFNNFSDFPAICESSRIYVAAGNLSDPSVWRAEFTDFSDMSLSDLITEKIISISTTKYNGFDSSFVERIKKDKNVSPYDNIKLALILAKFYFIDGDIEKCKEHLRYLENFSDFDRFRLKIEEIISQKRERDLWRVW